MKKERKEKIIRQKTKRFTLTSKEKIGPESPVEIRRRLSKEEKKIQGRVDEENICASIVFSSLDEFKCSEMKVSLESGKQDLTTDEWAEVLKVILDSNVRMWETAFITTDKNCIPQNMLPAINDFKEDPAKPGFHLYEVPVAQLFSVYWLLGMSVGLSIGTASGNHSLGMCFGLSMGMCIGLMLDMSEKKRRKNLKIARGMPVEEPEKKQKKKNK